MVTSDSMMDRMIRCAVQMMAETRIHVIHVPDLALRMDLPLETVRSMFPDDAALTEAIGTFSVLLLSDALTRALIAVPTNDNRAALIALGTAYVEWAYRNPDLYQAIAFQQNHLDNMDSIVNKYDASLVPLVQRYLGETDGNVTRRAGICRSFIFGLADMAMDDHFSLWFGECDDIPAELRATITDFADILLSWTPPQGASGPTA